MRAVIPLVFLSLFPADMALAEASGDSHKQLHFGLQVAKQGLWQEARFRFERAVTLDPTNPRAYNNLAVALEQQGDFAKAREAYEKALALKPGNASVQQNYDLFREADDKRNRKAKKKAATPTP
jgi:type IV pilus assembly protein PilF